MDNYSYSSYADSRDSSPRSRDIDCENPSWDEPPSNPNPNYKVKFMCSYGGKIQPRAHDNQLTYTGGETKILAVDRNINFSSLSSRLSSLCDFTVCFKYQLPGEDLDALISVTNDEDLGHMMLEYDRLFRVSKPTRLRLFLFPLNLNSNVTVGFGKSDRQWFVDALNSVKIQPLDGSVPPPPLVPGSGLVSESNPDYLFGFDKGYKPGTDPAVVSNSVAAKDVSVGSDGSEDRHGAGEPEFQRQIQDLQRLQIAEETNSRTTAGENYYPQKMEKIAPSPTVVPLPLPIGVPAGAYLPERHMISSGYPVGNVGNAAPGTDPSMYLIPTGGGLYHPQTLRSVTGPIGQPYYGMHTYREPQVHNSVPQQALQQQPNVGVYTNEGIQMVQQKIGMAEGGYAQVGYDNTGRQVYFTTAPPPPYQTMVSAPAPAPIAVDGRLSGGGGNFNQEGGNAINTSSKSSGS